MCDGNGKADNRGDYKSSLHCAVKLKMMRGFAEHIIILHNEFNRFNNNLVKFSLALCQFFCIKHVLFP